MIENLCCTITPNERKHKRQAFSLIAAEAAACSLCPAMHERTAVLSERNGRADARVMFIGEAPGRQGGDRTRIPFSGDQSGRNFERYLASTGLTRERIMIVNAVLCNPRTQSGANRTPTVREVANCSTFLGRLIETIDPCVIVTLGRIALDALRRVQYHDFSLQGNVGKICRWHERWLVPLYHPSPQVLASHRREAEQLQDYKAVRRAVARAGLIG